MTQIYKFKNESDFLDFESRKIKNQIQESSKKIFQNAVSIFSLAPWVKKYPFVAVGTAFSVGVLSSTDYASRLSEEVQAASQLFNISAVAVLKNVIDEVHSQNNKAQKRKTNHT